LHVETQANQQLSPIKRKDRFSDQLAGKITIQIAVYLAR
jgi:hypothetical protein